jgi:hypothetical protein
MDLSDLVFEMQLAALLRNKRVLNTMVPMTDHRKRPKSTSEVESRSDGWERFEPVIFDSPANRKTHRSA